MSNLLNTAESSLNDVEIELKAYDAALEPVKSKQIEIFELEQAHQNNTSDISADFRTRLKIHSANSSALVLHRPDLILLQDAADSQKLKVIEVGRVARSTGQTLLYSLFVTRRADAKAKISAILDLSAPQVRPFSDGVELYSHAVLALKNVQYFFNHSATDEVVWCLQLRETSRPYAN